MFGLEMLFHEDRRRWAKQWHRPLLVAAVTVLLVRSLLATDAPAADCNPQFPPPLPAPAAFENLKTNARVYWLVRLVAYDPAQPELRIDKLTSLGGLLEDYSFVADYAELRGYTASEAARKAGGGIRPGQGLSGILFPLGDRRIYPASVRGMLQVIVEIDRRRAGEPNYVPARLNGLLTEDEYRDLSLFDRESWAWDDYRRYFSAFGRAFGTVRSQPASAIGRIGHVGPDWSEAGCSRVLAPQSADEHNRMSLELPDRQPFVIENFGVRVFLIRNLPLTELSGRMLIDFDQPERQRIPYFALPSDSCGWDNRRRD